jgi:hypothetical protein
MQSKYQLKFYLLLFFVIIVSGTICFKIFEDLSLAEAFYFCVVTIATVGYGDISPHTALGRSTALLLIVLGAGTFLGVMANATEIVFNKRGKQIRLEKLNIIIGFFFSETGTQLLKIFTNNDHKLERSVRQSFMINSQWNDNDYASLKNQRPNFQLDIDEKNIRFVEIKKFLDDKGEVLIRLLENPTLQEHEDFTELIIAILHLKEELTARNQVKKLSDADRKHLAGDCKRAYFLLVDQWINYVQFIQKRYPFLFSLAVRQNPFDIDASVEIQ